MPFVVATYRTNDKRATLYPNPKKLTERALGSFRFVELFTNGMSPSNVMHTLLPKSSTFKNFVATFVNHDLWSVWL